MWEVGTALMHYERTYVATTFGFLVFYLVWCLNGGLLCTLTNYRAGRLQRRQQCATVPSDCSRADRLLAETCGGVARVQPS